MWQEGDQELVVVSVAMDVASRMSSYMMLYIDLVTRMHRDEAPGHGGQMQG